MSTKHLVILDTAYRANLEEQDDPVLWLTHSLRRAGADLDLLLRGNAVNYGVKTQDASGLVFGDCPQSQPPRIARDVRALADEGVRVFYVDEDARERGIARDELIDEVEPVSNRAVSRLFESYTGIWQW